MGRTHGLRHGYSGFNPLPHSQRFQMSDETIQCIRCAEQAPLLVKPPFRNELGDRIREKICSNCWKEWLEHQTVLINHYGLDPRDPKSKDFLYGQIEQVLLQGGDGKGVDTSQQGSIEW
jgi:Fe-S cluster biosynthesis and repair protein YggX